MQEVKTICTVFGIRPAAITPLTQGLINQTFKVADTGGDVFIVQQINTRIFQQPLQVQQNFVQLRAVMKRNYRLPELIPTAQNELMHVHGHEVWRCFTYMKDSYTPTGTISEELAYTTAKCFGEYTRILSAASPKLHTILPRFHDVALRAEQLLQAKAGATTERLKLAGKCLTELDNYDELLKRYKYWAAHPQYFPQRILHHDAKPSNILFSTETQSVLCPIDLDTTQTGLCFSDFGDMIRSMVPSHEENDVRFADIEVRQSFLQALTEGYMDATHTLWTAQEKEALAYSGKMLLYMQAMRFLADFLNNDAYYQTKYELHNLDRTINQLTVLRQL
ncbi:phosphotransferase enzyme family protein [Phnomibacter sp. MR]|uniref:phosphotransferase enzyme family protein n=1 Tax=Phnomibacter sp. MR TaxID=3042318 RepID=UPI003A7FB6B2